MNNINPNLVDPSCITTSNSSFYPIGSAQHLDPNYNILPFLCDLLKMSTDPNATGLLTDPIPQFDITPFTDFSPLSAVGDPRVSLGDVMTQTYINFLPRVITQTEVRQAGGTQVINNYICTADGTPIKQTQTSNALLSLDLTGQKAYKYGAITVPPVSASFEDLMKPIHPDEIKNFVKNYVASSRHSNANDFATFIKNYFPNYSIQVDVYKSPYCTLVTLGDSNSTNNVYLKYYADVAINVGCLLGVNSVNQHIGTSSSLNHTMAISMASTIPDYALFAKDSSLAKDWYIYIMNNFVDNGQNDYTNLFTNLFTSLSAGSISQINSVFASASASLTNQNYNTVSVPCSSFN
jgi:hypothetical protein